jgi:hypothetical protein
MLVATDVTLILRVTIATHSTKITPKLRKKTGLYKLVSFKTMPLNSSHNNTVSKQLLERPCKVVDVTICPILNVGKDRVEINEIFFHLQNSTDLTYYIHSKITI